MPKVVTTPNVVNNGEYWKEVVKGSDWTRKVTIVEKWENSVKMRVKNAGITRIKVTSMVNNNET